MKVERPPELWEADTEDSRFVRLLGEIIAAALSSGTPPGEVTLKAANIVVELPTMAKARESRSPRSTSPSPFTVQPTSDQTTRGILQRLTASACSSAFTIVLRLLEPGLPTSAGFRQTAAAPSSFPVWSRLSKE